MVISTFLFERAAVGLPCRADRKANRKPFITHSEILLKSGKKCQGVFGVHFNRFVPQNTQSLASWNATLEKKE